MVPKKHDPPEDRAVGAGAEELGHGGGDDREQPAVGEAVHRDRREQRPVSLDRQQQEQSRHQQHQAEDVGVPAADPVGEGADRHPADDARPTDQRKQRRRRRARHAEVDAVHRDVQGHRHQGGEEQELGQTQGPERAAATHHGKRRTPAFGRRRRFSALRRRRHREGGDQQQRARSVAERQRRIAPAHDGHQHRGQQRQHHLTGRGADLHDSGHHAAPRPEPARDGRERHHVMGGKAQSDEDPEQRDELPRLADDGDESEAHPEQQTRGGEDHRRPVPVAQASAEVREHPHDQDGKRGAPRQDGPRPAELFLEDVEEQADREQQADDRELRQAGAEDDRVSWVH